MPHRLDGFFFFFWITMVHISHIRLEERSHELCVRESMVSEAVGGNTFAAIGSRGYESRQDKAPAAKEMTR